MQLAMTILAILVLPRITEQNWLSGLLTWPSEQGKKETRSLPEVTL